MIHTFIARACADLPVAACCRVTKVSTSGFFAWQANPVSPKDLADAHFERHHRRHLDHEPALLRVARVLAELRLGQDVRCSRKRVERLMRQAGIAGIHRRRRGGCTRRDLGAQPSDDLVNRAFDPAQPDRLWVMDVAEHPTAWIPAIVATFGLARL